MNMTTKNSTPSDQFLDALTDELIAMPDEQVLQGIEAKAFQASGLEMLTNAKTEAGRRRLAAAKARAEAAWSQKGPGLVVQVPADEARRYLASAANDERYTMAARNLNEMSDDDVLRLYAQLKRLESQDDGLGETDV